MSSLESLYRRIFFCTECKDWNNKEKKELQGSILAFKSDKSVHFAEGLSIRQVGTWIPFTAEIQTVIWVKRGLIIKLKSQLQYPIGSTPINEPCTPLKRIKFCLLLNLMEAFFLTSVGGGLDQWWKSYPKAEWDQRILNAMEINVLLKLLEGSKSDSGWFAG